jgi:hypothetical protein
MEADKHGAIPPEVNNAAFIGRLVENYFKKYPDIEIIG